MSSAHRYAYLAPATLAFSFALSLCLVSYPSSSWAGELCPYTVGDDTRGIVSGDFNGDGLVDVAVSSVPIPIPPVTDVPKITVFLGSSGSAVALPGGSLLTGDELGALVVGDMNEDGALDLVASGSQVSYVRVMPGDGHGSFALGETFPIVGGPVAVGDFNGDAHLDVAAYKANVGVSVLFGDGQGHLGPEQIVTSTRFFAVVAGDLNGDGRADIVGMANDATPAPDPTLVFLGNADGTFTALPPQTAPHDIYAAALGDMNEDGYLDVVASGTGTGRGSPNVATYLGNGDGTFVMTSAPEAIGGFGMVRLGDVDGDGHLDALTFAASTILVFCDSGTPLYFHHGMGNGTLADGLPTEWRTNTSDMALADLNGDGFLDAALPGCGAIVFRPGGPNGLGNVVNAARAFTIKNNDVIRLNANKSTWCVHVEGVNGSLDVTREGLTNVAVFSVGTGSQSSVLSNSKERIIVDSDANGVTDQEFCFPKDQLRQLFSGITGTQTVNVTIEGTLTFNGCRFRAPLSVTVITGGGGQAAAAMNPNVFSTSSVLSFQTSRGQVRARIYDVSGRLVKTLIDGAAEAGPQRVRVEARDGSGKALPSGVYFFRIDSPNGLESGRFVIAR